MALRSILTWCAQESLSETLTLLAIKRIGATSRGGGLSA